MQRLQGIHVVASCLFDAQASGLGPFDGGEDRRDLRRERARRLGDEPLERHAARGAVKQTHTQRRDRDMER